MKRRQHHPSAECVREIFLYDSETGIFRARVQRRGSKVKIGDPVGYRDSHGYLKIWIGNGSWYAHLLAWLYVYGDWPAYELDHSDGNVANNAITNLRTCTHSQNAANQRLRKKSERGVKGVSYVHHLSKWKAQITVKYKVKYLGCYSTIEEAHAAYMEAARQHHGEFARGR